MRSSSMMHPESVRTRAHRSSKSLRKANDGSRAKLRVRSSEALEPRQMLASDLVISEFLAQSTTGPFDNYGVRSDWIEIRNVSSESINLAGWHLTDDDDELAQWTFPSQSIAPGAYLIVWASEQDDAVAGQPLHTNFKLNNSGEYLALVRPDNSIASEFSPEYPGQTSNVSYGRSTDLLTEGYFAAPTFGTANVVDPVPDPAQQVVITEIMYHPATFDPLATDPETGQIGAWVDDPVTEEYIEIHNRGTQSVNLLNWQFDAGVTYTFSSATIGAGQYLVIAANVAAFNAKYPGVTNVIGGWTGQLSNRAETVRLINAVGTTIDRVEYADKGDWAVRVRGPLHFNHNGWEWQAPHDGEGKSLEVRNRTVSNNYGQNWGPSNTLNGTPGVQNSLNSANIAPMIIDVAQNLAIPHSDQQVTVTARLINETPTGVSAQIFWRRDNIGAGFAPVSMFDDGLHGDGGAGDGLYGGQIPNQPNNAVVEYFVQATDGSQTRSYPNFVPGPGGQTANLLYQVNDSFDTSAPWTPGSAPFYMFVMTEAERAELAQIGSTGDANSNAQMNGTFIVYDGTGVDLRYNVGIRNRGHGSRFGPPNNYLVRIPSDRMWNDTDTLAINSRSIHIQNFGHLVFQHAGLTGSDTNSAELRINGQDLAQNGGGMFGRYVDVELPGSDYAENHFPDDNGGNIYRGVRLDNGSQEADFRFEGNNPDAYRDTYFKETNESVDDWSDLINLTNVLNNAPDGTYLQDVSTVIDVQQWLRFIALNSLMVNTESGLNTGVGDDYAMYRGETDTRFKLLPHDLDSIFQQGGGFGDINQSIFTIQGVDGLNRFINHPQIVPLYYQAFLDLLESTFNRAQLDPLVDQVLGGWVNGANIANIKTFITNRSAAVLTQIQQNFTISSVLPLSNGYRQSGSNTTTLTGTANVAETRSVLVNGVAATWNNKTGAWSRANIPLNPGINRVKVEAFSGPAGTGELVDEGFMDIWYDLGGGGGTPISFDLPTGSTWKYLDDDSIATEDNAWRGEGFNDSGWDSGPAQLGYSNFEENDEATLVSFVGPPNNKNLTTYFRTTFNIPAGQSDHFAQMSLFLLYDDGASIYLNGTEIVRQALPGALGDNAINRLVPATGFNDNGMLTTDVSQFAHLLHDGVNTLAVEIHQNSGSSSDISFDMSLSGTGMLPGGGGQLGGTPVSGTIAANTTWSPQNGPYVVTAPLTVAAAATLTILPGTTVFFETDASMTVNGRLVAEGTEYNTIRFSKVPGAVGYHLGIQFINTMQDNRIRHAVIEWGGDNANNGMVGATDSRLTIEDSALDNNIRRRIRSQGSSIIIRRNTFNEAYPGAAPPTLDNFSEHIWGGIRSPITQQYLTTGQVIIEDNVFGKGKGHNDAVDFDGGFIGQGHIVPQILNNRFLGGGDDAMDLEGDFYVAGNLLTDFIKDQWNTALGHANGLSLGGDGGHIYYVVGNTFENVERIFTAKQAAVVSFLNNTVIGAIAGGISFNPPDHPVRGQGGVIDSNIFVNSPQPFDIPLPVGPLVVTNNVLPANQVGLGTGNISTDPRLKDLTIPDVTLMPGSSAIGTGTNGIDRGSQVSLGASISGEPAVLTASTSATLTVRGPGILAYKYRVNGGAWSAETPVATPISLGGLANGAYTVEVVGKNFAGVWQADADATESKTWTVNTALAKVLINEVLASNVNAVALGATRPDVIELYNPGATAISLQDMSITDELDTPRKYVFGAGVSIPAGGYLVLYADSLPSQSGEIHLGFSLSGNGEGVHLFDKLTAGGGLVDEVNFGLQLPDKSVGRVGQDRHWALTSPTFGSANLAVLTGDSSKVKINEWFTEGQYTLPDGIHTDDFIELYNTDTLPVSLAGLFITDDHVGEPTKHQVSSLSFINPTSYAVFNADDNQDGGPEHLNFSLDAQRGWIAVLGADGSIVDRIYYMPQTDNVSQGRVPDGGPTFQFMTPSPGIDSSPPSTPQNLIFTVNQPTQVTIAWDASLDPQSGVSHYRVYRNSVFLNTSPTTSYNDLTVVNGQTYSYQVSAVNGNGFESALSSSISTNTDNTPPTVPTNFIGNLSTSSQITLVWTESTDPQSGVKQYNVYRNGVLIGTPTGTTFDDSSFVVGAPLSYTVSAVNNADVESAQTAPIVIAMYQNGVAPTANYVGTDDTILWQSAPDLVNQGGRDFIRIDGDETGGLDVYALVRFSLSGIPAGQQIRAASISLTTDLQASSSSTQPYEIYAVKKPWSEATGNWNSVSTGVPWEIPGAKGTTDRDPNPIGVMQFNNQTGTLTFHFNALGISYVQQWVNNPSTNHGILLASEASADGLVIDSSEDGVSTNRPRLNIVYSTPVAADTTPPSAPTNVLTSDNGTSMINLTWTAASDPESGVDSYRIFRDGVQIGTSATTNFSDPTAVPGRAYSYRVAAVNGVNLVGPQSTAVSHTIALDLSGYTVRMSTRDSYLPGVPVLVQLEILGPDGKPVKDIWNAGATLTSSNPAVTLSSNEVILRNGYGSALVTPTGTGTFTLTAGIGNNQTQKTLTNLQGSPVTTVSGTLPGASTNWSGVVNVTGNLTVPAGHTLTIQPGTLVLINGTAALGSENATTITVQGRIQALGTANQRITFTATNPSAPWGEISHIGGQASLYQYVDITRAGHSVKVGHTNTGPALRMDEATVTMENSAITDVAGKMGWMTDSNLVLNNTHWARMVMGPELTGTGLQMTGSYVIDMLGIYQESGAPNDNDGIYIHAQGAGKTVNLTNVVFAGGDDDSIDTLGSDVVIRDAIIRDYDNPAEDSKGISIFDGDADIARVLIVGSKIAISAKGNAGTMNVLVDRATLFATEVGIQAERQAGDNATINYFVKNSISLAAIPYKHDYSNALMNVTYSDAPTNWPGTGNLNLDPLWINPAVNNWHLTPASPVINMGNPADTDPNGTRADMGVYPYTALTVSIEPRVTSDTTPTLTGSVNSPTAVVRITVGPHTAYATNHGNGTWTLPGGALPVLADGIYNVFINAREAFGQLTSDSTNNELTIDTAPPTVTVNTLTTSDTTPPLSGTVSDPAAVIQVTVNGNSYPAVNNGNGTWTLPDNTVAPLPGGTYNVGVTATDQASNVGIDATVGELVINVSTSIAGRHLFYNQSRHDGNSAAAGVADDGAIATDKTALMPGQTATFANVSSYTRGINGLMVDIAGLPGTVTAGDFDFKIGNSNTPSAWAAVATAPSVSIRPGAGVGGSSRITLIWPSGAIIKQWLQVTVKANATTGLATPDVFYYGNAMTESGNGPDFRVTVSDEVAARNNPYSAAANGNVPAPVTNKWDYNRDGNVSVTDQTQARANQTTVIQALRIITVPSLLQGQGLVAQSLSDNVAGDPSSAESSTTGSVALEFVNATSSSSSSKVAAAATSVVTGSTRAASRLSAQALETALSDLSSDNLSTSSKRANVDGDLLDLLSQR